MKEGDCGVVLGDFSHYIIKVPKRRDNVKTRDMSCWNCFHSNQVFNEELAGILDSDMQARNVCDYVICYLMPEPKMISEYADGTSLPHIVKNPHFHVCGLGQWIEDDGLIGFASASDSLNEHIGRHALSFLRKEEKCTSES